MMLWQRKNYIKAKEAKIREKYGKTINIVNVIGSIDCPDCSWDSAYRRSTNPNCLTCLGRGKIIQTEEYSEKVLVFVITEEEIRETEVGGLKVGDYRLIARNESKEYFKKAALAKTPFMIDEIEVLPFRIIPDILEIQIKVYCSRITE